MAFWRKHWSELAFYAGTTLAFTLFYCCINTWISFPIVLQQLGNKLPDVGFILFSIGGSLALERAVDQGFFSVKSGPHRRVIVALFFIATSFLLLGRVLFDKGKHDEAPTTPPAKDSGVPSAGSLPVVTPEAHVQPTQTPAPPAPGVIPKEKGK